MRKNIPNRDVRACVQTLETFDNSTGSLWSTIYGDSNSMRYVVFSYGPHWPLFVYDYRTHTWFENKDKYSVTTSRHRSVAHPNKKTKLLGIEDMQKLSEKGYKHLIKRRLVA